MLWFLSFFLCFPLNLRLSLLPCWHCSHCKATSPAFSLSSPYPHPFLLALSPTSSILGFSLSFLPPLPVYHSSIHPHTPSFCYSLPISPLQRFQSLPSPHIVSHPPLPTIVVVQAKSSTTCPVWMKSCRDWRERHRNEEQLTEEKGRIWVTESFRYWAFYLKGVLSMIAVYCNL